MALTTDWFSHNIPVWEKLLARFKGLPDLRFLEIGCYEGRSTLWLIENILTSKGSGIQVIDTFEGSPENIELGDNIADIEKNFQENVANKYPNKVEVFKGTSQYYLRKFEPVPQFHFIYIDGSHIASDVLEDAVLAFRLLKEDGIMIFDDYGWKAPYPPLEKPKVAIDAFLYIFKGQYITLAEGYQIAIQKIPIDKK